MTHLQSQILRMIEHAYDQFYGPDVVILGVDYPDSATRVLLDRGVIINFYRPDVANRLAYLIALLDDARARRTRPTP